MPAYLTGRTPIPEFLPDGYSLGSPEEAMLCAAEFIDLWNETPGAIPWLLAAAPEKHAKPHRRR